MSREIGQVEDEVDCLFPCKIGRETSHFRSHQGEKYEENKGNQQSQQSMCKEVDLHSLLSDLKMALHMTSSTRAIFRGHFRKESTVACSGTVASPRAQEEPSTVMTVMVLCLVDAFGCFWMPFVSVWGCPKMGRTPKSSILLGFSEL